MAPGEAVVKSDGGKKRLIIDYRGMSWGPDIAQYGQAFQDVVEKLRGADADEVVLSEYYERIYDEKQTNWLREVADLINNLEADAVWSPSHLGKTTDSKTIGPRHDAVLRILSLIKSDPFKAYLTLVQEMKGVASQAATAGPNVEDVQIYLGTLRYIRQKMEEMKLIQAMKDYLSQLGSIPEGRTAYHAFFESSIKPSFIGSRIFFSATEQLELVDQYDVGGSKVYIYRHPDQVQYLYFINPPEYSLPPEKYFLLEKTKEVVAQHRPESVQFLDITQARKYFRKVYVATIADLALKNNIKLSVEEKEDLASIVARYTIGYGILEILLSDRRVTDVYIDSPLGDKPVYLVHGKYGQCQTNVIFSNEEARSIVSRFRALSGRPFDEAHPILDFDLEDLQTRIAVIGKPLALDGIAFAFRLHKQTPWTLAQFVDVKEFDAFTAGVLSFFVDAQASMLIVGSRGSGKTSLLQSMMLELPQNLRTLVQEDSVTGDTPIIVERDGKIQTTQIGKLTDELFSRYHSTNTLGVEKLFGNPEDVKVFAATPDGKIELKDVSCFIRHKTSKPLSLVKTNKGRQIKVTHDHCLFTWKDGKIRAVKTNELKEGDKLVVADIQLNQSSGTLMHSKKVAVEKIKSVEKLPSSTGYVYDLSVPECENFVCAGILAHNTQELPVPQMKKLGLNIQRLKTRPPLGGGTESEVSAEDALRTALRLGDSVLIVGEVRSSIRGNEEVLVVENNTLKRIPIASLKGKDPSNFLVPTLDFDGKAKLALLTAFVEHPPRDKLLEVTTKSGRKITVTHDHSLFTVTPNLHVAPIKCKSIKPGDTVAVPSKLPCGFYDKQNIDVTEILPEARFEGAEEFVREVIKKIGWKKASEICGIADIYLYLRTTQKTRIPVVYCKKLSAASGITLPLEQLRVTWGTSTSIPAIIPVNEDFCKFLGYYISEGYYSKLGNTGGAVIITNSNENIIDELLKLSNKLFSIQPEIREIKGLGKSKQVRIQSSVLARLFSRLGCNRICTEKAVPEFIFGLHEKKIVALLRGLFEGDSTFHTSARSGTVIRYSSTSKRLIEDVNYLLLTIGIVVKLYETKRTPPKNNIWHAEFTNRQYIDRFLEKVGYSRLKAEPVPIRVRKANINIVSFAQEEFENHPILKENKVIQASRRCSKFYLQSMLQKEKVRTDAHLNNFANGDFFIDVVKEVKEITLEKPEPVYDLSVNDTHNFICGFGGFWGRNTEAKALYEAMRVGAVGNVVMGTIHGESAYSIWDRVVNDLGVPTTSFKATDFCVVAAPIRFRGSLKRYRRLIELTEVKKDWSEDPGKEDGFLQWMTFDANKDAVDVFKEAIKSKSEWLAKIQRMRGLDFDQVWNEITARGYTKQYLVDQKNKLDIPRLLEAEYAVRAHMHYLLASEKQREELGKVDYPSLLDGWKKWVDTELVADLVRQKENAAQTTAES